MTTTETPSKPGQRCEVNGRPMVWLGGQAYAHPDLETMLVPIGDLKPHPENPRNGDQDAITSSVQTNGLYRPCYAQRSTSFILAGNHTTAAVAELEGVLMPVIWLDVDDTEARKILLADNRTADLGRYDEGLLLQMLTDLQSSEATLLGTGYDDDDLALLADSIAAAEAADLDPENDDDGRALTTGEMLELADVTWGEPRHKVHHGEVWKVGRHTLVIAKLHDEHHLWSKLLTREHLFAPYPEPYLTTSEVARDRPLLLVQPNVFLAGHLMDKHASTHPDDKLERIEGK